MSALQPCTFGRYSLLGLIAKGGMGEVYLARFVGAAGFEKRCVIKKILPERAQDPTFVQKFLNEGRTLVALTHSNIVQVFDMGDVEGEYYLAMEHISGADLRFLLRYLRAHKVQLSESVCCYIMMETLKGLSYAHRAVSARGDSLGIIHRDVSPSNVLVSAEGEVKLIDFGIAKSEVLGSETFSGVVQGKFNYMSPEQARGGLLDQRTDIFSAGVVLYEMLTGRRPFEGKSDLQTLELVKSSEHHPLCGHRPGIHPALEAIVARALQKQPEERFQSADEFYAALEDYLRACAHVVNARDLVAAFELAFQDASTMQVGTSQDVFDEALRSLLDAQARCDDVYATRSMRLTDSFSERLPKACPADFASALQDDASPSLPASSSAHTEPQRRRLSPFRYALVALCIVLLTLGASKIISNADATQHASESRILPQPQSHTVPLPLPQFDAAAAVYRG
ncbi:MAG: serine/threonine protein kinase, partial [Proteobacteria bacterium]|nr:serine/threonine protein kinase [Pseudomonadota bacterium]